MILKLENPVEYTIAIGDEEFDYAWGTDGEPGFRHLLTSKKQPYVYRRLDRPSIAAGWGDTLIGVIEEDDGLTVYLSDNIIKTNKEIPAQIFFSFERVAIDLKLVKEYFKSLKEERKKKKKK